MAKYGSPGIVIDICSILGRSRKVWIVENECKSFLCSKLNVLYGQSDVHLILGSYTTVFFIQYCNEWSVWRYYCIIPYKNCESLSKYLCKGNRGPKGSLIARLSTMSHFIESWISLYNQTAWLLLHLWKQSEKQTIDQKALYQAQSMSIISNLAMSFFSWKLHKNECRLNTLPYKKYRIWKKKSRKWLSHIRRQKRVKN